MRIAPLLADQWVAAMARAIAVQEGIGQDIAAAMTQGLGRMARGMINFGLASEQTN